MINGPESTTSPSFPKERGLNSRPLKRAAVKRSLGSTPQSRQFRVLEPIGENTEIAAWVRKPSSSTAKKNKIPTTKIVLDTKVFHKITKNYPHLTAKKAQRIARTLDITPETLLKEAAKISPKSRKKIPKPPKALKPTEIIRPSEGISTPLLITVLVLAFLLFSRVAAYLTEPT